MRKRDMSNEERISELEFTCKRSQEQFRDDVLASLASSKTGAPSAQKVLEIRAEAESKAERDFLSGEDDPVKVYQEIKNICKDLAPPYDEELSAVYFRYHYVKTMASFKIERLRAHSP